MADYSLDEIFEKKMYFLIPFYFFNLEGRFAEFNKSEKALQEFADIYYDIIYRLEKVPETDLSQRSKGVIMHLTERVVNRLASRKKKVSEKVGDIMGGEVIKIPWLEKYDADIAAAKAEGEAKGVAEGEKERKALEEENQKLREELAQLKAAAATS